MNRLDKIKMDLPNKNDESNNEYIIRTIFDDLPYLLEEVEKLRKALEFYAEEENHVEPRGDRIFGDIFYDRGKIARDALK